MTFETLLKIISAVVLLVFSVIFGFLGKTTAMGFSISAGFLGLVFSNLDKFQSFKAGGVEARLREQIEAVLEKETESPQEGEDSETQVPNVDLVPDDAKKVLSALQSHEYTWRYISGISKETKLSRAKVKEALKWLSEHSYAKKSLGKNGDIWTSTQEGRYLFAVICFSDVDGGVTA